MHLNMCTRAQALRDAVSRLEGDLGATKSELAAREAEAEAARAAAGDKERAIVKVRGR